MQNSTFIDLFAGIGGIRLGFTGAGFENVFSSEFEKYCQKVYFDNYTEMPAGDITEINEKDIPSFDILTGGFPCQPFSISGHQKGFEDTRGTLFFDVLRIIKHHQPKVVFLENVKHLVHHDKGNTLSVIVSHLEELGYKVSWKVLNAIDFGSAQNRERIIIIANKNGLFNFDKLEKQKPKRIIDILSTDEEFEYLNPNDYTLIDKSLWKTQKSGLIFVGYRNKSQRIAGVRPDTLHLSRVHKQPNRIYSVLGTHPTLPSQESSGRFWILLEDGRVRKLTLKECYRLQGFPENFKIDPNKGHAYLQVGNAVYVPMMTALAKEINLQFFQQEIPVYEQVHANTRGFLQKSPRQIYSI